MKTILLLLLCLIALFTSDATAQQPLPAKTIFITLTHALIPSREKRERVNLEPEQELIVVINNEDQKFHNSTMDFGDDFMKDPNSNAVFYEIWDRNAWHPNSSTPPPCLAAEPTLNTTGDFMTYHFKAIYSSYSDSATIYFFTPVLDEKKKSGSAYAKNYFSPAIDCRVGTTF